MSSSTPSKLPASAPTFLELGNRRSLEVSRTVPASSSLVTAPAGIVPTTRTEPARLALGTNPPSSGLDAHLIAIGTPPPGSQLVKSESTVEPKTVNLGLPSYVRPRSASTPPRPRASIALAMILGLLALAIAPLAPITWMHAAEQLDLVARGARRPAGKRLLHAVHGIGIAMTMVAVAATAFAFTVLVARYAR